MTQKEAIKILKRQADGYYPKTTEALIIAIKALEQEPCEDAVSRQAVKDILDARGAKAIMTFEHFKELLDKLPSVTPQPKTVLYSGDGYADGYMVYDMAECPNCGYSYEEGDKDWGLHFCPNCGQSLNWESEGDAE